MLYLSATYTKDVVAPIGNIVKVTASTLNVRSGPSTSNSIVKTIPQNSKWYILDVSGNWYKIATNQWISATYTAISTPLKTVQVTVNTLNIRSGPSTSNAVIRTLPIDSIVDVLVSKSGWYKINNYEYIYATHTKDVTY